MMRRLFSKRTYIVFGILCCMFLWLQFGMESYAFTRTTGEVTGSSVKVRKEASTSAEMVASVRAGDDLDVVDAVNGTDGKVWYKILINANEYGYIRSDFVTLASGEQAPSQNTNTNTTTGESEVTPIDEQKGHTSTNNVKVRKQATTASDEVDRLNQDQIFTISGTSQGPDSKIWYYVSYVDGGASKKGFIRSDLVTIIEEETQDEPSEEPEQVVEVEDEDVIKPNIPAPTTTYEAVYTTDETGNYVWYLYDRTANQRYKIEQILNVNKEKQQEIDDLSDANFGLKVGLIITVCLLVMVGVAIAYYVLKMKEEQENSSYRRVPNGTRSQGASRNQNASKVQSTVRSQGMEKPQSNVRPQNLAKPQTNTRPQNSSNQKTVSQKEVSNRTGVQGGGTKPAQNKLSWKAKNFLEDNDEMEFGFLDFDEDDE